MHATEPAVDAVEPDRIGAAFQDGPPCCGDAVVSVPRFGSRRQPILAVATDEQRVRRALLMTEPASVDGHEMTDKGYINQRATLERRKALVDKVYAGGDGVIEIPA